MATELLLHANKSDYEALIGQLDGKLNELRSVLSEYQTLKNDVEMFIQDGDSNFENMRANVQANIDAVQRAIGVTQSAKDGLQKTVDQMDEASANISNLMTEAAEFAGNTIKTAIRIEGLGI